MLLSIMLFEDKVRFEMFSALLMFIAAASSKAEVLQEAGSVIDRLRKFIFSGSTDSEDGAALSEEKEKFREFGETYAFRIKTEIVKQQQRAKAVKRATFREPSADPTEYF